MRYRSIGSTGLLISEIGFGTGGNAGLMTQGAYEDQRACVVRAIELGINYFDTSPDYGEGSTGEVNLGRVLRDLGVRPVITTKVEVRAEDLGDIAGHVERSVDQSLQRLGVDYVDIVQIHNGPTVERPQLEGRNYRVLGLEDYFGENGAIQGLERIQRAGKTRFLGFICRGDDGEPVRQLIDTGLFQLINAPYTLLNPTAGMAKPYGMQVEPDFGDVMTYAAEHGVGVAIYSPLGGGPLTDQALSTPVEGSDGRSRGRQEALRRARALQFLSQPGRSLAQAAYQFILMHAGTTTVLSGISEIGQLDELVPTSGAGPLTPEEMARIEMVWRAN
jgi:L-glyceraldehyde 3-phosphate reductase